MPQKLDHAYVHLYLYICTHSEEIGFCTILDGRLITTDTLQLST